MNSCLQYAYPCLALTVAFIRLSITLALSLTLTHACLSAKNWVPKITSKTKIVKRTKCHMRGLSED